MTLAALAQTVPTGRLILLIGAAIAVLIIFGLIVLKLRRSLFQPGEVRREPLSMETLQRQRQAGEISEEEFRSLRRALLGLPARPEDGTEESRGPDPDDPSAV